MKKAIKFIVLIITVLCIFSLITPKYTFADIDTNSFNPYKIDKNEVDEKTVTKYTNKILGVLSTVGVIVSVIALMIVGLKFIIGSATEKAEYKKTLVPIIIGILIIAFISTILGIFASLGDSINEANNSNIIVASKEKNIA